MEEFASILSDSSRVLLVPHAHADVDAVGSAVGLAATLDGEVAIARPDSVDSDAETLLDGSHVVADPEMDEYDLVVVVDAPSRDRIAPHDPVAAGVPYVVIDHHESGDLHADAAASCIDTAAPATAMLVAEILSVGECALPERAAMALAAGLLDDTGFRAVIMDDAYEWTVALLEQAGGERATLADVWSAEPSWSERMASAKALVRATGYRAGETIVLTTRVGGEEGAAVHALMAGNADIGVVVSPQGARTRVVARVAASSTHSFSLPEDLLEPLAASFGGDGGGHASAGAANLASDDVAAIEDEVIARIEDALGMQFGTFS